MLDAEWIGGPYDGGTSKVPEACERMGYLDIAEPESAPFRPVAGDTTTPAARRARVPIERRGGKIVLLWGQRRPV